MEIFESIEAEKKQKLDKDALAAGEINQGTQFKCLQFVWLFAYYDFFISDYQDYLELISLGLLRLMG